MLSIFAFFNRHIRNFGISCLQGTKILPSNFVNSLLVIAHMTLFVLECLSKGSPTQKARGIRSNARAFSTNELPFNEIKRPLFHLENGIHKYSQVAYGLNSKS